jgi:AcrR family transcriptional regulator
MAPNPASTKQRLISAAEQLFASRGIDGVSLREINAAAGQRNSTALQYHFVDRAGLVRAVLAKHHADIEAIRHEMLDLYEEVGGGDLRALAGALVRPSATKLSDLDGGRAYLRIHAQVVNLVDRHPHRSSDVAIGDLSDSTNRWRYLVAPLLPDVAVRRLHHRFTAIRLSATELARRAAVAPRRDDRLFISHLIDVIAVTLATPMSEETAGLLHARAVRADVAGEPVLKPRVAPAPSPPAAR